MNFQNKAEYLLLIFVSNLLFFLKNINRHLPSKILSFLLIYIFPLRREVIRKNLHIAFPHLTPAEINKLLKNVYKSSAKTLVEVIFFRKFSETEIWKLIAFENFEIVEKKIEEKRGLILLTAHYGNWELGALAVGLKLKGSKLHVLVKQQRNPYVTEWLNEMRTRFGNLAVPLGASVRNIYKVLQQKGVVGVVGDQRGPKEGLRVKFFNRDTAVYPGTAAIALKLNVPIVFAITVRDSNDKYTMYFEELNYDNVEGSLEEKIQQINQMYMNKLESYIEEHPEQWFWMHNIWKY